ncbi:hypothetical protein QYF36_007918 [Acer negundo]|nr:hypothetical protein QYF36_007918 [Acer negundo]
MLVPVTIGGDDEGQKQEQRQLEAVKRRRAHRRRRLDIGLKGKSWPDFNSKSTQLHLNVSTMNALEDNGASVAEIVPDFCRDMRKGCPPKVSVSCFVSSLLCPYHHYHHYYHISINIIHTTIIQSILFLSSLHIFS